jgi:hypothetical protein
VRQAIERKGPLEFDGTFFQLPLDRSGGLGKPLKSTVHPFRPSIPIFLGAEGPYRQALNEGFARRERPADTFEVTAPVPVVVDNDVERAANLVRPIIALYVGGMGAKGANFHFDVVGRMGFEGEAQLIQHLYLSGRRG